MARKPTVVTGIFLLVAIIVGVATREHWLTLLQPSENGGEHSADPHQGHVHGPAERIKLSPQARANLRLSVKAIQPQTYTRTLQIPGSVVEQRSRSDRVFVAPFTGIVQSVTVRLGDTVQPGDELVTLRLTSESFQTSQTELYKTVQEIKITEDQKRRLEDPAIAGAIAGSKIIELQYQLERLQAARRAYRADLAIKGLGQADLDLVETGKLRKEIVVRAPGASAPADASKSPPDISQPRSHLEVEDLKVHPGEQVQGGQVLGILANHHTLFIEGRGFREDASVMETAAGSGWPLEATFLEEQEGRWPPLEKPLKILYFANTIDPVSQTFPIFIELPNQFREYQSAGKTYRVWRFRPGQRVQLGVPVEKVDDVFVLPIGAVVREGPDAFVFRQNGDFFDRRPVTVLHEESRRIILANDGSLTAGTFVAHNGADALNRAMKARAEGGGGGHDHHGHSH